MVSKNKTPRKVKRPPKLEGWITEILEEALKLYMQDHHLRSRTEVLNSAVGKFLEHQGYLKKDGTGYKVTTPEEEAKRIGFHGKAHSQPFVMSAVSTYEHPSV